MRDTCLGCRIRRDEDCGLWAVRNCCGPPLFRTLRPCRYRPDGLRYLTDCRVDVFHLEIGDSSRQKVILALEARVDLRGDEATP